MCLVEVNLLVLGCYICVKRTVFLLITPIVYLIARLIEVTIGYFVVSAILSLLLCSVSMMVCGIVCVQAGVGSSE